MLNVIRAIVVIVGAISLIILAMDMYDFVKFKMNDTLKFIFCIIFIICSIFLFIDEILTWLNIVE